MQTVSNPFIETIAPGVPSATIIDQVQARSAELTRALATASNTPSTRADIEGALAALAPMLTGDLVTVPEMVSRDLSRWLEQSKYLGISAAAPAISAPEPTLHIDDSEGEATIAAVAAGTAAVQL